MRALLTIGQQAPSLYDIGAFIVFIDDPLAMKPGESKLIGQQAISCNPSTFVKI